MCLPPVGLICGKERGKREAREGKDWIVHKRRECTPGDETNEMLTRVYAYTLVPAWNAGDVYFLRR